MTADEQLADTFVRMVYRHTRSTPHHAAIRTGRASTVDGWRCTLCDWYRALDLEWKSRPTAREWRSDPRDLTSPFSYAKVLRACYGKRWRRFARKAIKGWAAKVMAEHLTAGT